MIIELLAAAVTGSLVAANLLTATIAYRLGLSRGVTNRPPESRQPKLAVTREAHKTVATQQAVTRRSQKKQKSKRVRTSTTPSRNVRAQAGSKPESAENQSSEASLTTTTSSQIGEKQIPEEQLQGLLTDLKSRVFKDRRFPFVKMNLSERWEPTKRTEPRANLSSFRQPGVEFAGLEKVPGNENTRIRQYNFSKVDRQFFRYYNSKGVLVDINLENPEFTKITPQVLTAALHEADRMSLTDAESFWYKEYEACGTSKVGKERQKKIIAFTEQNNQEIFLPFKHGRLSTLLRQRFPGRIVDQFCQCLNRQIYDFAKEDYQMSHLLPVFRNPEYERRKENLMPFLNRHHRGWHLFNWVETNNVKEYYSYEALRPPTRRERFREVCYAGENVLTPTANQYAHRKKAPQPKIMGTSQANRVTWGEIKWVHNKGCSITTPDGTPLNEVMLKLNEQTNTPAYAIPSASHVQAIILGIKPKYFGWRIEYSDYSPSDVPALRANISNCDRVNPFLDKVDSSLPKKDQVRINASKQVKVQQPSNLTKNKLEQRFGDILDLKLSDDNSKL